MFDTMDSYDCAALYTTIPHKLIKEILSYLIKWSFRKSGCGYLCYNEYKSFLVMTQEINTVIGLVMT